MPPSPLRSGDGRPRALFSPWEAACTPMQGPQLPFLPCPSGSLCIQVHMESTSLYLQLPAAPVPWVPPGVSKQPLGLQTGHWHSPWGSLQGGCSWAAPTAPFAPHPPVMGRSGVQSLFPAANNCRNQPLLQQSSCFLQAPGPCPQAARTRPAASVSWAPPQASDSPAIISFPFTSPVCFPWPCPCQLSLPAAL